MSGTQDEFSAAQELQSGQSGIDQNIEKEIEQNDSPQKLSASQKMDLLLRGTSGDSMKKEIEKLRKESAKYRVSSRDEALQKQEIEQKAHEIQKELDALKSSHKSLSIMRKLDKAGCIKSELVAKDMPADCENLDDFIESYKSENAFLFKTQKQSRGGTFKPSVSKSLTPSQQMDAYIRRALGR